MTGNEPVGLRAGPVSLELRGCELAYAQLGDKELVRRIYVGVRTEAWDTVQPDVEATCLEKSDNEFAFRLKARNREGPIDFRWESVIEGKSNGQLSVSMEGEALSRFLFGRIGLCVLHAASDYAGKRFVARCGGSVHRGLLPIGISPQRCVDGLYEPLVPEFDELEVELTADLRVVFQFEGDLFEMEDQRNWTDASFKTYSTPLRLGGSHEASPGQRFSQSVTVVPLCVEGRPRLSRRPRVGTTIDLGPSLGRRLPGLGAQAPALNAGTLDERAERLLEQCPLSHVRVDIRPAAGDAADVLLAAAALARITKAGLELVLHADAESAQDVERLLRELPRDVRVVRVLALEARAEITSASTVGAVRQGLAGAGIVAPVGGGTPMWFAEINRNPPDSPLFDFVSYAISPQLHMQDDTSIIETLSVQALTVNSARELSGGKPIVVGPVFLNPRGSGFLLEAPERTGGDPGGRADARQGSLFCAAWTLASIKQLAFAGAEAMTYHELFGPRGLFANGESASSSTVCSEGREPFPVYQVMVELNRLSRGELLSTKASDPLAAECIACVDGRQTFLMLANLRDQSQTVTIGPLPPGEAIVRLVRSPSTRRPDAQQSAVASATRQPSRKGTIQIDLDAYSVANVTVSGPSASSRLSARA